MAVPADHEILLVEDNPADVDLFKLALAESDIPGVLRTAPTGEDALSILAEESMDLVILDLNLPVKSGLDVLEELRDGSTTSTTPILILSSSDDPEDICEAYELGANAYIVKRMDFDDTVSLVEALNEFWLNTAELPQ